MNANHEPRVVQVLKNFSLAVDTLRRFLATPIRDDRDRAGVIQAFEFCYELAWNTLKKLAEEKGLQAASPIDAFQAGFQLGYITESEHQIWLDMKRARNLTSHTYREELAAAVLADIQNTYVGALETLRRRVSGST